MHSHTWLVAIFSNFLFADCKWNSERIHCPHCEFEFNQCSNFIASLEGFQFKIGYCFTHKWIQSQFLTGQNSFRRTYQLSVITQNGNCCSFAIRGLSASSIRVKRNVRDVFNIETYVISAQSMKLLVKCRTLWPTKSLGGKNEKCSLHTIVNGNDGKTPRWISH